MELFLPGILLFLLKIFCFTLGYLIVRLGYKLISAGVTGKFNFTADMKGTKLGLASSSPGLLFVLLGTFLIGYAIKVDKSVDYTKSVSPASEDGGAVIIQKKSNGKIDTTYHSEKKVNNSLN
ncbi:hypothetical protein [Mucilaginibacter ginsenosidivorax]|uniref:Uncharacterized protein n=1 Tax=Mucilaginibacter ginsenosidivorax TaxID=862126 RepID=A0A5B8VZB5_9SPHI|nr:hypothetical protein [Mucilaginibacter ginsenosidivorax]QEC75866.1 hypothetical protein FSB76_07865 [Mucilaginibacter ginsenosidivorax]